MKLIFVVLIGLTLTFCCENGCSGHGECGNGDKCDCFPGWGGSCPYSDAFVDLLPGDLDHDGSVTTGAAAAHLVKSEWSPAVGIDENTGKLIKDTKRAHRYAECSNTGICDRVSGLCNCFSGYEGSACQRRSCPTSSEGSVCSGHGMCMSSEESIIHKGPTSANLPSGWEFQKFGVCVCDKGWTGISCGSRVCPKGIDPVTKGSYTYTFKITGGNGNLVDSNSNKIKEHYYKMVYDGITYTTTKVPERDNVCTSASSLSEANEDIRRAISSIPPLSQAKVSIQCDTATQIGSIDITTPYIELDITKGSGTNGGTTNKCNKPVSGKPGYCTVGIGGSDGFYTVSKPSSFSAYQGTTEVKITTLKMTATSMSIDPETDGSQQTITGGDFISCSGRGLCDGSSGLCECFEGYGGLACEKTRNN